VRYCVHVKRLIDGRVVKGSHETDITGLAGLLLRETEGQPGVLLSVSVETTPTGRRPTLHDAKNRRLVRLPDGRTAHLVAVTPLGVEAGRHPLAEVRRGKVRLPSGRYLSIPITDLEVVSE
jgi:hypothetical protein